jgi:hypothetical protein
VYLCDDDGERSYVDVFGAANADSAVAEAISSMAKEYGDDSYVMDEYEPL